MRTFIRIVLGQASRIRVGAVLALAMAGIGSAYLAPAALAATPASLAGELFIPGGGSIGSLSGTCASEGNGIFTFTTSGMAAGPYPGTFTEAGSFTETNFQLTAFDSTFTITSAAGSVTGSKGLDVSGPSFCFPLSGGAELTPSVTTYTATIDGAYQDTGTASVSLLGVDPRLLDFSEDFLTSNGVTLIVPTSKDQCKDGGWQTFGTLFKNQGDCVSFVATGGNSPPSGS